MKHLDHQEVMHAVRKIFRTGKRFQDLKGVHSRKKEENRFTKQIIENQALSFLNEQKQFKPIRVKTDLQRFKAAKNIKQIYNKKAFSQVVSNAGDDLYLVSVEDPHCTWGEWGGFAACNEIEVDICKKWRVRDPENIDECDSYNIDVAECKCQVDQNKNESDLKENKPFYDETKDKDELKTNLENKMSDINKQETKHKDTDLSTKNANTSKTAINGEKIKQNITD